MILIICTSKTENSILKLIYIIVYTLTLIAYILTPDDPYQRKIRPNCIQ